MVSERIGIQQFLFHSPDQSLREICHAALINYAYKGAMRNAK